MENEKIHHYCQCTGQKFTFEEWCKWLENNDRNTECVTYGEFSFNIFDVCLTPNIPVDWKNKYCSITIKTAQSHNGRWDYGLDVELHTCGRHSGVSFVDSEEKGYASEREAIFAGLDRACEYSKRNMESMKNRCDFDTDDDSDVKTPAILPYLKGVVSQIEKYMEVFNPRQLSLF